MIIHYVLSSFISNELFRGCNVNRISMNLSLSEYSAVYYSIVSYMPLVRTLNELENLSLDLHRSVLFLSLYI